MRWDRYPLLAGTPLARTWLRIEIDLGIRPNTVAAYGRGVEDYLRFLAPSGVDPLAVTREHIALYVADLRSRPSPTDDQEEDHATTGRVGLRSG